MFDRPERGDRALLVEIDFGEGDLAERLDELEALALVAGGTVTEVITARRAKPDPALFAGSGKVAEIAARRIESGSDIVIFDHSLSGAQQRNLERALDCRVVDRVSLILDIFARRVQPRAANRRHRAARAWRDAARERPPPDRSARQVAQGSAPACRPPARDAATRATARRGSPRS